MTIAVHWFRNGLRLHDNPALVEAQNNADNLITLFIFDETTFSKYNTIINTYNMNIMFHTTCVYTKFMNI